MYFELDRTTYTFRAFSFCNQNLKKLQFFSYQNKDFYGYLEQNKINFVSSEALSKNEERTEMIPLEKKDKIDQVIRFGKMIICSIRDTLKPTLRLYNIINFKEVATLRLPKGEISKIIHKKAEGKNIFLITLSILMDEFDETYSGQLVVVQVVNQKIELIHQIDYKEDISDLIDFEGKKFVVLEGDSNLKITELSLKQSTNPLLKTQPSLFAETKLLLSHDVSYLVNCIASKENRILISDFYWSVFLFKFEKKPTNRLVLLGKFTDMFNKITSINLLSLDTFSIGDNSGNLIVAKIDESPVSREHKLY